jgi:hypothetical protein
MFHRARSEFLKLFYRAPDQVDVAILSLSQQLLPALSKRDFDALRMCLFEQALKMSKTHVALLWLAFATLPGNATNPMFLECCTCLLTKVSRRVLHLESPHGKPPLNSECCSRILR